MRAAVIVAFAAALGLQACDGISSLGGEAHDNEPPSTVLSNVPPPNDTDNLYSPLVRMSWTGVDTDGFVTAFEVSWVTYHLNRGDSVVHETFVTTEETMVIPFESSDDVNRQRIVVKAIDNDGAIDPVGAERVLYTRKGIPPETILYYPTHGTTVFVAPESTPSWEGIGLYFSARDEDGGIQGYSVRVDDGDWSPWQTDTTYVITPDQLRLPLEGTHTVSVRAQDDTFIIDEAPVEIDLQLIEPSHERDWLIVDATIDDPSGATERPTDEDVDSWYRYAMDGAPFDSWDLASDGPIDRERLGQYQHVLWHNDVWRESSIVTYRAILSDYVRTGGRLVLSGWDLLERFDNSPAVRDSSWIFGDFVRDVLHVEAHATISDAKMAGALTVGGDTLHVDHSKLFSFRDGLYRVSDLTELGPFADPLMYYVAADSASQHLDGRVVALGYQNPDYRIVFSGFPLSFLTLESGRVVMREIRAFLDSNYYF